MSEELVSVSSGDGIRLQGFIEIELVNEKEHYTKTYKNTITKGGKQFLLGHSAAMMLGMSANMHGNAMVNSGLINQYNDSNSIYTSYNQDMCLTNLLLFLDTLQTGLTESSTWVNLFDDTGVISGAKVIGYANNNVSPTANGKEGRIDYCKDEYMTDGYTVCERWKYPEGVATGTIDTIAMAPAGWKTGKGLGGQRFSKCLDKVNVQEATFTAKSTQFCPPGIPGFTSNDEILLNYSQDGVEQHKYSISTGEITDNPTTWFVFPAGTASVVKIGNYVYSLYANGTSVQVYLASDMSYVDQFSLSGISGNDNNRLLVDSSNTLWVSSRNKTESSSYVLAKCGSNSGTYFNKVLTYYTDFSQLFTIPTGLRLQDVNFGMCGSNYVMFVKQSNYFDGASSSYTKLNNYVYTAIIFSNPSNIMGSIVDIIPEVYNRSMLFAAGSIYGVIDIGYNNFGTGAYMDSATKNRKIINNSGSENITSDRGCYLTLNGWYSTLLSFVKLTTPIVKQDTDIMYVSYGYKVV